MALLSLLYGIRLIQPTLYLHQYLWLGPDILYVITSKLFSSLQATVFYNSALFTTYTILYAYAGLITLITLPHDEYILPPLQ